MSWCQVCLSIDEHNNLEIHTVWKLQDFSVTQILREIKVGQCRVSKAAILEALIIDFSWFLHFLKAEIYQINEIQST